MPVSARIEYVNPPAEGEAIAGDAQVANVRLSSSTTGVASLDYYAASANSKGHGLVVRDLEPGTYFAEITSSYGGWYVASAVSGATDLLSDDLTVLPGAPAATDRNCPAQRPRHPDRNGFIRGPRRVGSGFTAPPTRTTESGVYPSGE